MAAGEFEEARDRAKWNAQVRDIWAQVRFVDLGPSPSGPLMSGKPILVPAGLDLAGLQPRDVRVECVIGRIGSSGGLEETEVIVLPFKEKRDHVTFFEKEVIPAQTGRLGYALRVSPNHNDDPLTRPVTSLIKWGAK